MHTICARMTEEFLRYSVEQGNDLVTPMPQFQFQGSSRVTTGVYA